MLVTALGLLLGGRADTGAVRTGARAARVEGVVARRRRSSAAIAERARRRGRGRPAAAGPAGLRRGSLPRLPGRRVGARVRARRASARRSSPCTASPTSTGCCGPRPSATRSTRFAGAELADGARRATGPASPGCARSRPSCARCSGPRRERAREADVLRLGLEEIEAVDPQPGEEQSLATEESTARVRRHAAHRRRDGARGAVVRPGRRRRAGRRGRGAPGAGERARARPRGRRAGRPGRRGQLPAGRRGRRRRVLLHGRGDRPRRGWRPSPSGGPR